MMDLNKLNKVAVNGSEDNHSLPSGLQKYFSKFTMYTNYQGDLIQCGF